MKKYGFTILLVLGCLLAAGQIKAYGYEQTSYNSSFSEHTWANQYFATSTYILPTSGNLESLTFKLGRDSGTYSGTLSAGIQLIDPVTFAYISTIYSTTTINIADLSSSQYTNEIFYFNPTINLANYKIRDFYVNSTLNPPFSHILKQAYSNENPIIGAGNYAEHNSFSLDSLNGEPTSTDLYFIMTTDEGWACSHWTDYANCIWEGNPVYPTGNYGTGNCVWFGNPNDSNGFCKNATSGAGTIFGLDETSIFSESPVACTVNEFPSSNATMSVPVSMNFYNPPVCSGSLMVCQPNNITYRNIKIHFYDSYNVDTSSTLISSVSAGESKAYAGTIVIPSGTYRTDYTADGIDNLGMTYPFVSPLCLTIVSTTSISTSTNMNYWGTSEYLACTNAYQNCIASSTSFLEKGVCGIQGVFWSLFCPSPEALAKVRAITADEKNRFPITLVTAISNAFSAYSSSTGTSSATTSYVSVDISGFAPLGNLAFFADLRSILTALGLFAIGIWTIKYTQNHFFKK